MVKPITYVNRRGDTYTLYMGTTKTGKPKYYVAKKGTGRPAEKLPDGYEIHETPNGRVYVRRKPPIIIFELEEVLVEDGIRRLSAVIDFRTEVDNNMIVVYTADNGEDYIRDYPSVGLFGREALLDRYAKTANYTAELRFVLVDAKKRLFVAHRYCFRSSVDDWICLSQPEHLKALVERYAPHLGHDSFYELTGPRVTT